MNVDPKIQATLLELAGLDTELNQLAHRRRSLPEQQVVDQLEAERLARKDAAVAVEIVIDDLDRDIRKLEAEVDAVRKREDRDRSMLAAGNVAAKQLTELQHELGTLERRQGVLEDELLEVMERREASQADYQHAGAQLSRTESDLVEAQQRRTTALADIDAAHENRTELRETVAAKLPTELLDVYERQRASTGTGAALLQARRCGACRIELDRGELSRISATAPDVVVRCPECSAILVRTKESGL